MIRNFASAAAHEDVSESWVTHFIDRNRDSLISKWATGMDSIRHRANSEYKYNLYFDLLHSKMVEYDILPHNTYNMDEKGFLIGVISRSKRIFSRQQWEAKQVTKALQDGSREFVTTIASVCADGTALPPGIVYASANSTLQSS
jgi:hypothetical protein